MRRLQSVFVQPRVQPLALALGALLTGSATAAPSARLYVTNEESGDVAVLDTASLRVVTRIPVGKRPRGIKLSPDGRLLYVALSGSPRGGPGVDESKLPPADRSADGIGVIDLGSAKLLRVLPSGQDPEAFDISADGRRLFVSNEETAEMSVIDTSEGKVVARVVVGKEPEGVTLRPDGKAVYVTCEQDNEVVAVDTGTLKVLSHIETGPRPRSITFSLDGALGFVASENSAEVTIVDVAAARPSGQIKIVSAAKKPLPPRPMGSVLSPDGRRLYVSNGRNESVAVIDVPGGKLLRVIDDVGARPWGIALSSDGRTLYTANGPSNDVAIIDVVRGKVRRRVKVGELPWGLALGR
jgi:YVTN family beta-propeller protein